MSKLQLYIKGITGRGQLLSNVQMILSVYDLKKLNF